MKNINELLVGAIDDALCTSVAYTQGSRVPGDIAEFGCFTGRTAQVIAAAIAAFDLSTCKLRLFDSFKGLPACDAKPDAMMPHVKTGVWGPGYFAGGNPEELAAMCAKFLPRERIEVHPGWFKDSCTNLKSDVRFAMLHVDCDLYQSTMDLFRPLLQEGRVSPGAVVLFDDWNCNAADPNLGERRAWSELANAFEIRWSDGGDYGWAGHKLIIHDYTFINFVP